MDKLADAKLTFQAAIRHRETAECKGVARGSPEPYIGRWRSYEVVENKGFEQNVCQNEPKAVKCFGATTIGEFFGLFLSMIRIRSFCNALATTQRLKQVLHP